jgi:glycosyltransferase involved in cell wall biosynthesis
MKIVIYSHAFAPMVGGVETIVLALARGLAGESPGAPAGGAAPAEVTVVTPTPRGEFDDAALPFRVVRGPRWVELIALVRGADILHLAGPAMAPMVLGLLLGKRVIVEHHGFQVICPNGQLVYNPDRSLCPGHFMAGRYRCCVRCNREQGLAASLKLTALTFPRRWLSGRAAVNVAPTRWLESLLGLRGTLTIHHGLAAGAPPAPDAPATPPVITYQGRLVTTKGVAVLLEAAGRLRDEGFPFQLRIIGDGPDRAHLEAGVARLELGARVRFLGTLRGEELDRQLAESTAVVMPSMGGEVFGLVALENMMRGRLVVASQVGALAEVVGDGGLTFPVGDAAALAERLQQVLTSPGLTRQIRRRARERSLDLFDQKAMIEKHRALYGRVMQSTRAADR